MSWDSIWENIFQERKHWGKYPPEELVRFVAKNFYNIKNRREVRILEIGCGPGAGPGWYIAREGFSYYAIDGSITALIKTKERFKQEGLDGFFVNGYFDKLPWKEETFDCVVDVASLQCNSEEDTKVILNEVYRVLKKNGSFFSFTSKSGCWGDGSGTQIDNSSYINISEGPYMNMGVIRFSSEDSIKQLYSMFEKIELEYSIRSMDSCRREISNWIISCKKM